MTMPQVTDYCCKEFATHIQVGAIENKSDGSFAVCGDDGQFAIWDCWFCPWCGAKQESLKPLTDAEVSALNLEEQHKAILKGRATVNQVRKAHGI
jgi:hypothetical protein